MRAAARPDLTLERVVEALRAKDLVERVVGPADIRVTGVTQDSREAVTGDLFLAWRGETADAHDFASDAVARGAVALVVERVLEGLRVPQILVRDGRLAAALAADLALGLPSHALRSIAVTGTNGKTTVSLLARHVLSAAGPAAAIGTLGLVEADGSVRPGSEGLTTPGPVRMAAWLRSLADAGVEMVSMEASSHALAQRRLDAIRFDVIAFTNLGLDHLDYHRTREAYLASKLRLVELLREDGSAAVNGDDPAWRELPPLPPRARRITYGLSATTADGDPIDVRATDIRSDASGSRFVLVCGDERHEVRLPVPGRFNVENALAAAAVASALGVDASAVAEALSAAPQVPGRLELVVSRPFTVVIDFAHTPEALEGVLSTLRPLASGRLIALFGAGGDRDREKRRPMSETVARWADLVLLTSDNPRTEDPERILDDLEPGLGDVQYERITDRRAAIGRALDLARPDDVVLLAGKGHERYQDLGSERRPFDEREIVREHLSGGAAA